MSSFPKEKFKISIATTKKVLKSKIVGQSEMKWLNTYIENRIQGECLPKAFHSNDLLAELIKTYGEDSNKFILRIIDDYKSSHGLTS